MIHNSTQMAICPPMCETEVKKRKEEKKKVRRYQLSSPEEGVVPHQGSGVSAGHGQGDADVVDVLGEVGDHVLNDDAKESGARTQYRYRTM